MYIYSYIVTRDYGFAPNPFGHICTLATCKPQIRKCASIGNWVAGFGGKRTSIPHKLVFLMRVDEACTFDEYWNDPRFSIKKPCFDKNYQRCYGDNIYHHINGVWTQENSHHSYENHINEINLNHDTRIDRVLISFHFWYFGRDAISLPPEFDDLIPAGRGHEKKTGKICDDIVHFLNSTFETGQQGLPEKWNDSDQFIRYKGDDL